MTLPRDLSGDDLVGLLRHHYGYRVIRQRGSHIRSASVLHGDERRATVPRHRKLSVGTLSGIISDVSDYLSMTPTQVRRELFGGL
ncbi:MAG: type II toxin-antitoxin system HicA family toxin [Chloroflexi bacterium]|nr:type II toxin-antitoxin system HicA family toxin [Chloroflexota bacterium]